MWSHIQNARPITSSAHPKKTLNSNLKESNLFLFHRPFNDYFFLIELRIYNASPVKTRQPTSEEARRHPIKAYTLRLSSRNKANSDHPNLAIKTSDKEHSPDMQGNKFLKGKEYLSVKVKKETEQDECMIVYIKVQMPHKLKKKKSK